MRLSAAAAQRFQEDDDEEYEDVVDKDTHRQEYVQKVMEWALLGDSLSFPHYEEGNLLLYSLFFQQLLCQPHADFFFC